MSSAAVANLAPPYVTAAEALRDNPGQWQAYESKGNCVVLAGPGSGKTKTLTIKMARMLAEDVESPRGIACITFNTECAGELRRRLEQLGIQESRNVFVGTIHSFCLKHVVLPYARLAGLDLPDDLAVALPSEQQRTFEDAFAKVISPDTPPESWRTGFDKYRRTHLDRDAPEWRGDDDKSAALPARTPKEMKKWRSYATSTANRRESSERSPVARNVSTTMPATQLPPTTQTRTTPMTITAAASVLETDYRDSSQVKSSPVVS